MPFHLTAEQAAACHELALADRGRKVTLSGGQLWAWANEHEVACIIGHHADPSLAAEAAWSEAHETVARRTGAFLAEAEKVAGRLAAAGIPVVALKNAGIAAGLVTCPGCSPMGDVDLLVRSRDFRTAHHLILEAGFRFAFRSSLETVDLDRAERSGGAEYCKELPGGMLFWLELQWRPVAGRWIRPDQEPDADQLVANSMAVPGRQLRILAAEDNLLQVCLHTAKHSFVRAPGLRLHLDVERIVRCQPLDWELFAARVRDLRVCTPVYFSLLLPQQLFSTPVPAAVLQALRPAKWKERLLIRWLGRIGLCHPAQRKFGRIAYLLFNALLFDSAGGLLRAVFPDSNWMRRQYGVKNSFQLPYYHCHRLWSLVFRRGRT